MIGIALVYDLVVSFIQAPSRGGSLLFLLILVCPFMMVFMIEAHNHYGAVDEKKVGNTREH